MSLLALIPARGGSKGIPRKNIKRFAGKPLIDWTIGAAKRASCIDCVVVTTEDEEIASVARQLGAEVPFMRPPELATDHTPGIETVLHAIDQLPSYDWVVLLQPTSPLRTHRDIDSIWQLCQSHGSSSAVSVNEVSKHPYWMYTQDNLGQLQRFIESHREVTRRQDLPVAYALNGAMYLAKTEWLLKERRFVGSETLGYVMPPERSVDLDTPRDWRWAEYLIEHENG